MIVDTALAVRAATLEDVPALADVHQQLWGGNQETRVLIEAVLADPSHELLVSEAEQGIVGFVDSFATLSAAGTRRWEVDLIGVLAPFRQRGLAQALVQATTRTGRARGAELARALIRSDNVASQQLFGRSGYESDRAGHLIYLWEPHSSVPTEGEGPFHLLPVRTMSYEGYWLEPPLTGGSIAAALRSVVAAGGNMVGSVIPQDDVQSMTAASRAAFRSSGTTYHWWIQTLQ